MQKLSENHCLNPSCGEKIPQTPKSKPKLYCNDACRLTAHRKKMKSVSFEEWDALQSELKKLRTIKASYISAFPASVIIKKTVAIPAANLTKPGKLKGESSIEYRIRMLEKK